MTDRVSDAELAEQLRASLETMANQRQDMMTWNPHANMVLEAANRLQSRRSAEAGVVEGGGGWRTIESAPRDGTSIIVGGPGYAYEAIFANGEWMVMDVDGATTTELVEPPTHWRPRPSPPGASGHDLPSEEEFLAQVLAAIESPEQCCGRGVAVERHGQLEEECCGRPEYGFERAAALIRERLRRNA